MKSVYFLFGSREKKLSPFPSFKVFSERCCCTGIYNIYTYTYVRGEAEREVLERERMEGRKQATSYSSSSSLTSELFGSKESSSNSGIFGSIFAPSSKVLLVSVHCFFVLIYWVLYDWEICDFQFSFDCSALVYVLFFSAFHGRVNWCIFWMNSYLCSVDYFFVRFLNWVNVFSGDWINASHWKKLIK